MTHYAATVAAACDRDDPALRAWLDTTLCAILTAATIHAGHAAEAGTLLRVTVRLQRGTAWRIEVGEWGAFNSELER